MSAEEARAGLAGILRDAFSPLLDPKVDTEVIARTIVRTADRLIEWQASREVTDAQPQWADTLVNDGEYEYTSSGDCDGSNVKYWRRRPRFVIEYTAWEPSSSEAHDAALKAAREVRS